MTQLCTICKENPKYVPPGGGPRDSYCYPCILKKNRERYDSASAKDRHLKRQFGISLEEYNALVQSQGGLCALCGKACPSGRSLAVDHCHSTHEVRGLLCMNCNNGLGRFKDNPELLRRAAQYLEEGERHG